MESSGKCDICGGEIEDYDFVVWAHGQLNHRRCALSHDGPTSRVGTPARDGAGTGLRRLGPRLLLRCRNGHEALMRTYVFEAGHGPTIRCSECGAAMRPV